MSNNVLRSAKYLAILLILTGSFSSCEKEDYNPEKFRLVKILYYTNSKSTDPTDGIEYIYDEAGNKVKELFYKYGQVTELYKYMDYEYSGNKKIKTIIFRKLEGELQLGWYIVYTYDLNNRLIKEEVIEADDWISSTTVYDYEEGNLVREYYYEHYYGDFAETKYKYDSQNRLILEEKDSSDDIEYKYIKHKYDNDGREIKLEYYASNEDLVRTVEKIYNGRSKLPVKDVHFDKYGAQISQYQHYYDKWGNLRETSLNGKCPLFKRKYNGGLLMEEIIYTKPERGCTEDEMIKYEYQKI